MLFRLVLIIAVWIIETIVFLEVEEEEPTKKANRKEGEDTSVLWNIRFYARR
jgi:hypothetical protein